MVLCTPSSIFPGLGCSQCLQLGERESGARLHISAADLSYSATVLPTSPLVVHLVLSLYIYAVDTDIHTCRLNRLCHHVGLVLPPLLGKQALLGSTRSSHLPVPELAGCGDAGPFL